MSQRFADFQKTSEDIKEIESCIEKDARTVLLKRFRNVVAFCVPILELEGEKYKVPTGEKDQMGNMKYIKYSLADPNLEQGDYIPHMGTLDLYKLFKRIETLLLFMLKTYKNDLQDMNTHVLDLKEGEICGKDLMP
jgi:hypothetical protein